MSLACLKSPPSEAAGRLMAPAKIVSACTSTLAEHIATPVGVAAEDIVRGVGTERTSAYRQVRSIVVDAAALVAGDVACQNARSFLKRRKAAPIGSRSRTRIRSGMLPPLG
jgi:hypothetical protein